MGDRKIKELKILAIAYQVAGEFDCVPDNDEDLRTGVVELYGYPEEYVELIKEYEGLRPDEITGRIITIIDEIS